MGVMTDGGKRVASISDGGKKIARFVDNGKVFSFNTPHATMTDYNPPTYGFSSIPQYDAFRALTGGGITIIPANQFFTERKMTGVALAGVLIIGDQAFQQCPLTYIYMPDAASIGENAFQSVVNAATTKVTMLNQFNTDAEKNRIFGAGHWNHITFHWLNADGTTATTAPESHEFSLTGHHNSSHNYFTGITVHIDSADHGVTGTLEESKTQTYDMGAYKVTITADTSQIWISKIELNGVAKNVHIVQDAAPTTVTWL